MAMPAAASYDLTTEMAPFLDRHLIFPLLEFLEIKEIHSSEDILRSKLDLLTDTCMVDFAVNVYNKLHKTDAPAAMKDRREQIVGQLKALKEECQPLLTLIHDEDENSIMKQLRTDKMFNFSTLTEQHNITAASVDSLYRYAKLQFDCGNYSFSAEYLFYVRALLTALGSEREKSVHALWGKLASEILNQNWESALEDLGRLKEFIESRTSCTPAQVLEQRTWLIHWSLFVFFNHPNGRNAIVDMFLQERYANTIQTNCPHILRYLTAAVITNKRRRAVLKDLVRILSEESYTYKDPITEFLQCLYIDFDFDGAQQKLRECESVLTSDFFLVSCRDDFVENARLFIFETYCRIHHKIDIAMLADKLNMDVGAAERWIVDLIRHAQLDAKIDSEKKQVIMGQQTPSVYQQVIEKTKGLSFRSYVMAGNLEKRQQAEATRA